MSSFRNIFLFLAILLTACGGSQNNSKNVSPPLRPIQAQSKALAFQIQDQGFQALSLDLLKASSYQALISPGNSYQHSTFDNYKDNFAKFPLSPHSPSRLHWNIPSGTSIQPLEIPSIPMTTSRSEPGSVSVCTNPVILEPLLQEAFAITGVKVEQDQWRRYLHPIGDGTFNCVFALHDPVDPSLKTSLFIKTHTSQVIKVRKRFSDEGDLSEFKHELLANHLIKQLAPFAEFVKQGETQPTHREKLLEVREILYTPESLGRGVTRQAYFNGISLKRIEYAINHYPKSFSDEHDPTTGDEISAEEAIVRIFGFSSVQDAYERVMALHDFYYSTDALVKKYLQDNQVGLYYSLIDSRPIGFDANFPNLFWDPIRHVFVAIDF